MKKEKHTIGKYLAAAMLQTVRIKSNLKSFFPIPRDVDEDD
jgi:hypothetical protein